MAQQRYRVLERIDAGGMAEVFRGEATSIEGFSKIVAIKRVLPSLTRKRRFVRMFLDEARLSLGLNHANIVQVFDLGSADGTYFIVMEYVEGTNLRTVLEGLFDEQQPMGVAEAVYIMAEVCKGLAYAHQLKDAQGRALDIVHRDVSPPNILLSRQGEVKLTDFGLAKARSQLEKTDPGIVKGKFGYLSPEAAYGEPIDQRTDLFAVGVVLWELLAAQRLFNGANESKTLDLVRKARVPDLTAINPAVPAELDRIVRTALMRDRNARFSDASDLARQLTDFLFDHNLKVGAYDIARLVEATLGGPEARAAAAAARTPAITDRAIEAMIQAEIEHFVSLDEADERAAVVGALEDPSTWFDLGGEDDDSEPGTREVTGLRVGPQVTSVSTAFPIRMMDAQLEGTEPEPAPGAGDDASDLGANLSMVIPIDLDLEAEVDALLPTDAAAAEEDAEAARHEATLEAAERLGARGEDTDAWADLQHLEGESTDGGPVPSVVSLPDEVLPEDDRDVELTQLDADEIGLTREGEPVEVVSPVEGPVAGEPEPAPEPPAPSPMMPPLLPGRSASQAMDAAVTRAEHVLRPRRSESDRRALGRSLAMAIGFVLFLVVAALIYLWR